MNITDLQAQATQLQSEIDADNADITAKQAQLDSVNAQIAQASTVNAIEAITDLTAVNAALEVDNSPYRVVDSTVQSELPPATEPEGAPV